MNECVYKYFDPVLKLPDLKPSQKLLFLYLLEKMDENHIVKWQDIWNYFDFIGSPRNHITQALGNLQKHRYIRMYFAKRSVPRISIYGKPHTLIQNALNEVKILKIPEVATNE